MLKVYSSLSRKKEVFKPRKPGRVNFFVCGPTVYDLPHLGHARTYIVFDMIVKYLRKRGFDVFYLQNITNIDDKIIKRAKEKKTTPAELASSFEKTFFEDMEILGVNSITKYARATDHIAEIISQVDQLLKKSIAYKIEDGIYYDIKKFKDYGKLSRRTTQQAEDGASRIDESKGKRNKGDFCLWKFSPPPLKLLKGEASPEPKWQSPWGNGRPGWHIEDTAITEKYFGPQYDAHGGGRDLIFPHHEAEIAQMEAISGKSPLVKYWLHTGFLTVDGGKMGKSFKNFITIKDFLKDYSPRVLRLFFLKSHYRSPIDYNKKVILQAKKELERIDEFIDKVQRTENKKQKINQKKTLVLQAKKEFEVTMDDDFNTPKALAAIFKLVNQGNILLAKGKLSKKDARDILKFLKDADKFSGFIFWGKSKKETIPTGIMRLVQEREKYRKSNDYKKADEIRQELKKKGWLVEDTKGGPNLKKM